MSDWLGDAMAGATKGGAIGSIVPGVGTAIGAAAGGLIGVALGQVPGLQHLIAGNPGAIAAAEKAVATITGTSDSVEAQAALDNDPDGIKAQLVQQLAEIANDQFKAQLADVAGARLTSLQLAQAGSKMAWGAAVVSAVLLVAWFASMIANYFGAPPLSADDAATLRNLAIGVAGYWVGSSAGSARKDDRIANLAAVAAK